MSYSQINFKRITRVLFVSILYFSSLSFKVFGSFNLIPEAQALQSCGDLLSGFTNSRPKDFLADFQLVSKPNGSSHYFFSDLEHASLFFQTGFQERRSNPRSLLEHLIPALNGYVEVSKIRRARDLGPHAKMQLITGLTNWISLLRSTDFGGFFNTNPEYDALYEVVIKTVSTPLYDLSHPLSSGSFSQIMSQLQRSPTEKLIERWLKGFDSAVMHSETQTVLLKLFDMIKFLDVDEETFRRLAIAFLKKDASLKDYTRLEDKVFMLNKLYLMDPTSAWIYYVRYEQEFLEEDLPNQQLLYRPFLYFKYVMGRTMPEVPRSVIEEVRAKNFPRSTLEKRVEHWIEDLGLTFQADIYDPQAEGIELDFMLKLDDGRMINIEVDGPHHFVITETGLLQRLEDLRRDEILEALGYEIYRIPYYGLTLEEVNQTQEELLEFLTQD